MRARSFSDQERVIRLWFFASMTLTIAMVVKECAVTGYRESFHWSYDLVLFFVASSLGVASAFVYRYERLLACSGFLCSAAAWVYVGRPTF